MPETQDFREGWQRELELLAKVRDELKLQAHLARAEVRDELDRLENTYQRVQEQVQMTRGGTEQPVKELSQAAKSLLEELRNGYARVREQLKNRPQ
jgi:hypothetical protein